MTDQTTPQDLLREGAEVYEQKNEDYGDSWKLTGIFLAELAGDNGIALESDEDFISLGLFTRRLDKIARAFSGEFLAEEPNFESVVDSHRDESVYAAMHASLLSDGNSDSLPDGGRDGTDTDE